MVSSSAARSSSTERVSRPSRSRIATCSSRRYPAVGGRSWVVTVDRHSSRYSSGASSSPVSWFRSNQRIEVPRMPRSSMYSRADGSTTPRSSPTTTAPARWASSARIPISASWSYRTYVPWSAPIPVGIHHSRKSPMMWSTRIPPESLRTVRSMSRYGA